MLKVFIKSYFDWDSSEVSLVFGQEWHTGSAGAVVSSAIFVAPTSVAVFDEHTIGFTNF